MWCIAAITKEYRERMYKLLDLYAQGYDEEFPVVCMDEKSKQLIIDTRGTIGLKPGSCAKYDYEYKRNGTRNIFVAVEPFGYITPKWFFVTFGETCLFYYFDHAYLYFPYRPYLCVRPAGMVNADALVWHLQCQKVLLRQLLSNLLLGR